MRGEVIDKLSDLVTAAFGLVAALAWNAAIQEIFKQIFGDAGNIGAMLLYAVLVTVVAVVAALWIGRVAARVRGEEKADAAS